MKPIRLVRLGEVPYGQGLALQLRLREALQSGEADGPGWLILLEHSPTVTLGKRGKVEHLVGREALAARGVDVFRIDRGGEATFHGPGQLVVYPIVRLDDLGVGVVDLIRGLASGLAGALAEYGVAAAYDPDHPGVWTQEEHARKVASVGMRVSRGVTTHGAAINLVNDMLPFSLIVPCGMPDAPMARVTDLVDDEVSVDAFAQKFLTNFGEEMGFTFEEATVSLPAAHEWEAPLDV